MFLLLFINCFASFRFVVIVFQTQFGMQKKEEKCDDKIEKFVEQTIDRTENGSLMNLQVLRLGNGS